MAVAAAPRAVAARAVEVRGLAKRYGDIEAVRGIDFEVAAGEIFGFLGPNGAGKSTTINMLCTLVTPDRRRSATVAGYDVVARARRRCAATSGSSSRTRRSTAT